MLNFISPKPSSRKCDGSSRRDFLSVGTLGLAGLTLPQLLQARARASQVGRTTKNTSVVMIFLDGGASHLETFDPKLQYVNPSRRPISMIETGKPIDELW